MVAPGNVEGQGGGKSEWPAGEPEGGFQGKPRPGSAAKHSTEVLHQRGRIPICPARLAIGGFLFTGLIGYLTLYSKKKPEATAMDVARVATGTATPENTRPAK